MAFDPGPDGSVTKKEGRGSSYERHTISNPGNSSEDSDPRPIRIASLEGVMADGPEPKFHAEDPKPGPVAR